MCEHETRAGKTELRRTPRPLTWEVRIRAYFRMDRGDTLRRPRLAGGVEFPRLAGGYVTATKIDAKKCSNWAISGGEPAVLLGR
jgi:hypothetical protein